MKTLETGLKRVMKKAAQAAPGLAAKRYCKPATMESANRFK